MNDEVEIYGTSATSATFLSLPAKPSKERLKNEINRCLVLTNVQHHRIQLTGSEFGNPEFGNQYSADRLLLYFDVLMLLCC